MNLPADREPISPVRPGGETNGGPTGDDAGADVVAAIGIGRIRFDNARWINVNVALCRMLGYSAKEICSMPLPEITHPNDVDLDLVQLRRMGAGEIDSYAVEKRLVHKDGRHIWARLTLSLVRDALGEPDYRIAIIENIHARKNAEEALRASEEQLRLLVESSPDIIFAQDRELRYLWIYNPAEPMTRERVIGRTDAELLAGDEAERLTAIKRKVLETGESAQEDLLLTPGGENPRWYQAIYMPRKDERGEVTGLLSYVRDVTKLKESEAELRKRESFYRQTLESIPGMVFTTRPDGYCDYQSQQWVDFTGVPMSEMVGAGWNDLLHPNDRGRVMAAWRAAVEERAPYELEYRVRGRDGAYEWFRVIGRPIRDESGGVVRWFGVAANINDLKRAEEELRTLNETLEQRVAEGIEEVRQQADRLRALAGELGRAEQRERKRLSKILHDHIQQLMVAARMRLEGIKRDPDREQNMKAVTAADEILSEAIDASRSLAIDLSPPVLRESGLVGGLNWLAASMQEKHNLRVHVRLDSGAEPKTEELRFLLFECARELLFNAAKHADVEDVQLFLAPAKEGWLRLVIADQGRGFDPDSIRSRPAKELTYGLFSIEERLTHMGGKMIIHAAPGRGSEITLMAPVGVAEVPEQEARTPEERQPGRTVTSEKARCRLLIVDDHKIMREGLVGLLQLEAGIEIVGEAADGPEAIALAGRLQPDVIIMDVNLKEMSGIEATRLILARYPHIKIIGLSMHLDSDVADAMHEAGASSYLTKGVPSEALIGQIWEFCEPPASPSRRTGP